MRVSHIGKTISDQTRKHISNSMKGKVKDSDIKYKIKESVITGWMETHGGLWYGNINYHDDRPQYCEKFNARFKERVRAFRGYVCFECGTPQNGKKLHTHHVHYDKKMCCNGSPQDIVPLCHSCHVTSNHNRDYWEDHFTELIYLQDPEGKCFFTEQEMKVYKAS